MPLLSLSLSLRKRSFNVYIEKRDRERRYNRGRNILLISCQSADAPYAFGVLIGCASCKSFTACLSILQGGAGLCLILLFLLFVFFFPSQRTRGCYKPLSGRSREAEVERCGRSRDGRGRCEEAAALYPWKFGC